MLYDVLEISQKLIRCASVTPFDDGAQDVLRDLLVPLGFTAQDYTKENIRNTVFTLYIGGATAQDAGRHLCFAGHTDVVPVGNSDDWTDDPFAAVVKDDVLYGRGACDMKTGITAFVAALSQFLDDPDFQAAKAPKGTISLLITGDEEAEALHGTKYVLEQLEAAQRLPNVSLVGEPTNPKAAGDEIKCGRRGSLTGVLRVRGQQGHVAYPQKADNPLPKLLRLCTALAMHEFDQGNEFFPATNLEWTSIDTGNQADNVIPAAAHAQFNVRFNDQWSAASLEQAITKILASVGVAQAEYDLQCRSNAESFLTPQGEWANLVRDAVAQVTGRAPELSTKGGTSDARFIAPYGDVVEYGLINTSAHQVDEHMPVAALYEGVEIYTAILKRYFSV